MSNNKMDTALLDKAISFAVRVHAGTERRGKGFPYIVHPLEAVSIVATITSDQELLAAAALHDVIEDTDTTKEQLAAEFGQRIADIVESESDSVVCGKTEGQSWKERKIEAMNRLREASLDSKIVAMGDKLSNMRAIAMDYRIIGDRLWDRFHVKDPREHSWRYHGLADALSDLRDTFAYQEFVSLVNEVFPE